MKTSTRIRKSFVIKMVKPKKPATTLEHSAILTHQMVLKRKKYFSVGITKLGILEFKLEITGPEIVLK
jgi:hypothetical protein